MDQPRQCLVMKKHYLLLVSMIAFGEVSVGLRAGSLDTRLSYSGSHRRFELMA